MQAFFPGTSTPWPQNVHKPHRHRSCQRSRAAFAHAALQESHRTPTWSASSFAVHATHWPAWRRSRYFRPVAVLGSEAVGSSIAYCIVVAGGPVEPPSCSGCV